MNIYFEKWLLVKDEKYEKKYSSSSFRNIINVAMDSGIAQLCRLVRGVKEEAREEEKEGKRKLLNFIISQYEEISVRDIILNNNNNNNKNPEDEDNVKLLRTFIITYTNMDLF